MQTAGSQLGAAAMPGFLLELPRHHAPPQPRLPPCPQPSASIPRRAKDSRQRCWGNKPQSGVRCVRWPGPCRHADTPLPARQALPVPHASPPSPPSLPCLHPARPRRIHMASAPARAALSRRQPPTPIITMQHILETQLRASLPPSLQPMTATEPSGSPGRCASDVAWESLISCLCCWQLTN